MQTCNRSWRERRSKLPRFVAMLALVTTLVACGNGADAQVMPPTGLGDVAAIAAGSYHSLALKSDGTVAGWGDNSAGQLAIPAGLSAVIAIAAGNYHSVALKRDGTVVAWGDAAPSGS